MNNLITNYPPQYILARVSWTVERVGVILLDHELNMVFLLKLNFDTPLCSVVERCGSKKETTRFLSICSPRSLCGLTKVRRWPWFQTVCVDPIFSFPAFFFFFFSFNFGLKIDISLGNIMLNDYENGKEGPELHLLNQFQIPVEKETQPSCFSLKINYHPLDKFSFSTFF
jgi:hypothetical protein